MHLDPRNRSRLAATCTLTLSIALATACSNDRPGAGAGSNPAPLGELCSDGTDCRSTFCASPSTGGGNSCSECVLTTDCIETGAICVWSDAAGYAVCLVPDVQPGGLGAACGSDRSCESGFCFVAEAVCSQCRDQNDCGTNQDCVFDPSRAYALCVGVTSLGDACEDGTECSSGYCNGSKCSECVGANEGCTEGGTCVSGGVGWFVCEGGVGAPCDGPGDCGLGFCFDTGNQMVCSECADTASDCGIDQECLLSEVLGWATCRGTAELGTACDDDADCLSGFCNSLVCSECKTDEHCSGTCEDDTAGSGWFVCTTALGDPCAEASDCLSGFCFDAPVVGKVCSLCDDGGDCGDLRECVYGPTVGYGTCFGIGGPGDSCSGSGECLSGFCKDLVCSECGETADCINGGACTDDTDGVGYWVCLRGLGEVCAAGSQCESGYCFDAGLIDFCSECESGTCLNQQTCELNVTDGYASCVGTIELGGDCSVGADCASGYCQGSRCSECEVNGDCAGGGDCVDDTGDSGYWLCQGGLGDPCGNGGFCKSGYCYNPGGGPQNDVCSECEDNVDCGAQRDCVFSFTYAVCQGTLQLGETCADDNQCEPGTFCNVDTCSECDGDGDCADGETCTDDRSGVGWFICLGAPGPLRSVCSSSLECTSGHCYETPVGADVCSVCSQTADCTAGTCTFQFNRGYAVCEGSAALGTGCGDDGDCDSGFCAGGVCSECRIDEHCGAGGDCVDDTSGSGYWICLAGFGGGCADGSECASGYCYVLGAGLGACSGCADGSDCGANQSCSFTIARGYALCVGTKDLGDSCGSGGECASGYCNGSKCSECESAGDCGDGGRCADEVTTTGWFVCAGGLGDPCDAPDECGSGHCYTEGYRFQRVCSQCSSDADCTGACAYDFFDGYASCP